MTALDARLVDQSDPHEHRRASVRRKRWNAHKIMAYVILVPGAILFVAPFAWLVSASFQPLSDIFDLPPHWIPRHPTLDSYATFIGRGRADATGAGTQGAWRWFANSAFVATSVTLLQLFFDSQAFVT